MIPLHDDNPTRITPYVTMAVIGACALVFLWELSLSPATAMRDGSPSKAAAFSATQRNAAAQSSTAAGNGFSGANR